MRFVDTDFREQYDLLDLLHGERLVKVSEMHWYEPDESVLGQPFFVMSRLAGRVPVSFPPYNRSGWLFDANPAQRRALWRSAVEELARIHSVPVDLVRFLDKPHLGASGLEQQLTYWERSISWSTGDANPDVLVETGEWLRANLPAQRSDGLSWGDARIGNMAFGDDFRLVGVMDWEQASLAGGLHDLGWWVFFDDYHSTDQGLTRLDGLGTRAETIELWEDLTGNRADDLQWHEVFAGVHVVAVGVPRADAPRCGRRQRHARGEPIPRAHLPAAGSAVPDDLTHPNFQSSNPYCRACARASAMPRNSSNSATDDHELSSSGAEPVSAIARNTRRMLARAAMCDKP